METKALELDETSKKFFITVIGQCRDVMNAAYDSVNPSQLQEPWLTHYRKIKDDYDTVLKELSPSDQVMAAMDANRHLNSLYSMLTCANSMCSLLTNNITEMKKGAMNALNSAVDAAITERISKGELVAKADVEGRVTTAVKAGIDAEIGNRITAGALVAKDTHTQLCSAAKELGLKEGRTAAEVSAAAEKARIETIATRKTLLATNGIPLPTGDIDAILAGTDEEFSALQATAKSRMENLMSKGVALNSDHALWGNIWKPEAEYKTFESLAESMVSGEPFANGGSRTAKAPSSPFLC